MSQLKDILLEAGQRPKVINDCVALVEDEVNQKSGIGGMAVKAAYTVVKKIKPGMIRDAVDRLLDAFVEQLESFYAEFSAKAEQPEAFVGFLTARQDDVANALLGVTDQRIQKAKNKTIKKAYEKLRPSGARHVKAAVPGVGRVISTYL